MNTIENMRSFRDIADNLTLTEICLYTSEF